MQSAGPSRGHAHGMRVATETGEPFVLCARAPEVDVAERFSRRCNPEVQEPVEQWLARIFERALRCSVVTGLLAQGCAAPPAEAHATDDGAEAVDEAEEPQAIGGVSCAAGASFPVSASDLKPARPVDYLALRQVSGFRGVEEGPERWTLEEFEVLSEAGTACATATTRACHQKIRMHPQPLRSTHCVQICSETSVVTTAGDQVRRWAGVTELRSLLGRINTPAEALLLVHAAGYSLTCDDPERTTVRAVPGGYLVTATKLTAMCAPIITTRYTLRVSLRGEIQEVRSEELSREENVCIGRVPEGLTSAPEDQGRSALGDWLSRSAHLEAASVFAFERMASELEALGAPASLVAEARRAAEDEVRHAKVVGALAQARGGVPVAPQVESRRSRPLLAFALENAVEGCVRETFGALVGAYQGRHARDADIAAAMKEIAADEARHAVLSWKVHSWAMGKLDPAGRDRIQRAQAEALTELAAGAARAGSPEVTRAAGLPGPAEAACLVDVLWRGIAGEA